MNEMLFDVCRVIVTIIGLVMAYYVIPALKIIVQSHVDEKITKFVNSCVYAAEQIYNEQGMGATKKKYVLKMITNWLNDHNVSITPDQIDVLIESAVLAMKTETK